MLEVTQEKQEVTCLVKNYFKKVYNIPKLDETEIDTNEWKILNSNNYSKLDPDYELKKNDRDYRIEFGLCVRCHNINERIAIHRRKNIHHTTLCNSCLREDEERLEKAFINHWCNKRLRWSKYGKAAFIPKSSVMTRCERFSEDVIVFYRLAYVESGATVNRNYTIHNTYAIWEET